MKKSVEVWPARVWGANALANARQIHLELELLLRERNGRRRRSCGRRGRVPTGIANETPRVHCAAVPRQRSRSIARIRVPSSSCFCNYFNCFSSCSTSTSAGVCEKTEFDWAFNELIGGNVWLCSFVGIRSCHLVKPPRDPGLQKTLHLEPSRLASTILSSSWFLFPCSS